MDLTELKTRTRDSLEVQDEAKFEANFDGFIHSAEERIWYLLQIPFYRRNYEGNLNTDNEYLGVPPGFKYPFSLHITDGQTPPFLIEKDVNYIREVFPDRSALDRPRIYATFNEAFFLLGPTPNQDYPVQIHYAGLPDSITTDPAGSTWISENAANALLYATIVEGAIFLQYTTEQMAEFKEHLDTDIGRLKNLGEAHNRRDAYRDGQRRQQVT